MNSFSNFLFTHTQLFAPHLNCDGVVSPLPNLKKVNNSTVLQETLAKHWGLFKHHHDHSEPLPCQQGHSVPQLTTIVIIKQQKWKSWDNSGMQVWDNVFSCLSSFPFLSPLQDSRFHMAAVVGDSKSSWTWTADIWFLCFHASGKQGILSRFFYCFKLGHHQWRGVGTGSLLL